MTEQTEIDQETYGFQAEVQQVLNLLVHSLYIHKDVFLRELISNASDALSNLKILRLTGKAAPFVPDTDEKASSEHLTEAEAEAETETETETEGDDDKDDEVVLPTPEYGIWVSGDVEKGIIRIKDNGLGMTHEELVKNLGTIAHSGTSLLIQQAKENAQDLQDLIGRFGVGFYSAFIVAERVEVITKSYLLESKSYLWSSDGVSSYTISDSEKEDIGTEVILYLHEDKKNYAEKHELRSIIKKHSDFIQYPIILENEIVNSQKAIWRKSGGEISEEEHNQFYQQLSFDFNPPLTHLLLHIEGKTEFRALLYIPKEKPSMFTSYKSDWGPQLYSKNVLIQEHSKDVIPEYFRFFSGVVDSEDIPLHVSREAVQVDLELKQIKKVLTGRIIKFLADMSKKDAEKYQLFWDVFGISIKEGVLSDYANREKLLKLLRFKTSKVYAENELTSLDEYISRMGDSQKDIYYLLADNIDVALKSPHLEYFTDQDLEVIFMLDPADSFLMFNVHEYEKKTFTGIDKEEQDKESEGDAGDSDKEEEKMPVIPAEFVELVSEMNIILENKVDSIRISERLKNSPCRLITPKNSAGREYEKVQEIFGESVPQSKKIFEINPSHPLILSLAKKYKEGGAGASEAQIIAQLFDNSTLLEGGKPDIATMVSRIEELSLKAIEE